MAVNDEAPMTNGEGSLNAQMTREPARPYVGYSDFVIDSSFVIRHSSFVPS
jgi:hypothetical protein